jgi:hypothetical protein
MISNVIEVILFVFLINWIISLHAISSTAESKTNRYMSIVLAVVASAALATLCL